MGLSVCRSVLRIKNQTDTLNRNLYGGSFRSEHFSCLCCTCQGQKVRGRSGPNQGQCVASQVKMERIQLEEEEWECETDLGAEFQDITSLLLQEPVSSRGQAGKQRSLWSDLVLGDGAHQDLHWGGLRSHRPYPLRHLPHL